MILHNVMWESRPLPKIVRDPLAAPSARGSFLYGASHAARACPIPQRPDLPSAILPVGSLLVPGTGRGALAVGERCKASTAGRGERMPVCGDAHRFAGEKRGFPASVLMAGERKQEGWGAGWHRHGATALPAPHPRYPSGHGGRCSRGRMAQRRAGRRCGASAAVLAGMATYEKLHLRKIFFVHIKDNNY